MFKNLRFRLFNYLLAKEGKARFFLLASLGGLFYLILSFLTVLIFLAFDLIYPLFYLVDIKVELWRIVSPSNIPPFLPYLFLSSFCSRFLSVMTKLNLLYVLRGEVKMIFSLLFNIEGSPPLELDLQGKGWEGKIPKILVLQRFFKINIFLRADCKRLIDNKAFSGIEDYLMGRTDCFGEVRRAKRLFDINGYTWSKLLYFLILPFGSISLLKLLNLPLLPLNVFLFLTVIILFSFFIAVTYFVFKRKEYSNSYEEEARLRFFTKVDSLYKLQANGEDISKDLEFYLILRGFFLGRY